MLGELAFTTQLPLPLARVGTVIDREGPDSFGNVVLVCELAARLSARTLAGSGSRNSAWLNVELEVLVAPRSWLRR